MLIRGHDGNLFGVTGVDQFSDGSVFAVTGPNHEYRVVHSFRSLSPGGGWLQPVLAQAQDGRLYGVTTGGATFVLSQYNTPSVVHLSGASALVVGSNNVLYGATRSGGTNGYGTVFRVNTDGTEYRVLHSMQYSSGEPTLILGRDGVLYGTSQHSSASEAASVFKINSDGTGYAVLHRFTLAEGTNLRAPLLHGSDGYLYGVAREGGATYGTVFRLSPIGTNFRVLHVFYINPGDGRYPETSLLEGSDGILYGITPIGGTGFADRGTIFSVAKDGTQYRVLRTLTGTDGDGRHPTALVEGTNGFLYGVTLGGGFAGSGTLFKLSKTADDYQVVRSFSASGGDGQVPTAPLFEGQDGALYGTTYMGGRESAGTVFRLDTRRTNYGVVHSFGFEEGKGRYPTAGVAQGGDGSLFGTTSEGAPQNISGVAFRINTNGSNYAVLQEIPYDVAASTSPADLIEGRDGILYGITVGGGTNRSGSIFKLNKDGSGYALLRNLEEYPDGAYPACLIEGVDGLLYGAATWGGDFSRGTVFRLDKNGSQFTVLHAFGIGEGQNPYGRLLQATDGKLYGTTSEGPEPSRGGTIYRLNADGSDYQEVHTFQGLQGFWVLAGLVEAADGLLYGVASRGGTSYDYAGTIFRLRKDGSRFSVLHNFGTTPDDGRRPTASLIQGSDGFLYGSTREGGAMNFGTIFRVAAGPDLEYQRIPEGIRLRFSGMRGRRYDIERAADPAGPWITVATFEPPLDDIVEHIETVPLPSVAFYRVRLRP